MSLGRPSSIGFGSSKFQKGEEGLSNSRGNFPFWLSFFVCISCSCALGSCFAFDINSILGRAVFPYEVTQDEKNQNDHESVAIVGCDSFIHSFIQCFASFGSNIFDLRGKDQWLTASDADSFFHDTVR